jgi:CheY-like chemotaxis protein
MTAAVRLLVVDDDDELRQGMQDALEAEGFETSAAGDGHCALELLQAADDLPAAILLDLMMPRMNGGQFREAQRRDARLRDIPVLLITASRNLAGFPLDDEEVLLKPFGLDELLQKVRRLIAG